MEARPPAAMYSLWGHQRHQKKSMCFSPLLVHRVLPQQSVAATSPVGIIRNGPLQIFGSMRAKLKIITLNFYNELQFLL
jgi:hypothetical protein